jgi:hypothetical protein
MSNHMWAQLDTLRASDMITKARNIKGKNYITINKYSLDVKDCLQFAEVKSKRGLSACQFEMYDNPFFMLGEGGIPMRIRIPICDELGNKICNLIKVHVDKCAEEEYCYIVI